VFIQKITVESFFDFDKPFWQILQHYYGNITAGQPEHRNSVPEAE